jgi:hypothetical protein
MRAVKRPGSLKRSAVALLACQTLRMIGPAVCGSVMGFGKVPEACAWMISLAAASRFARSPRSI